MKEEFNHTSKLTNLFILLTALSLGFNLNDHTREQPSYLYILMGAVLCISIPGMIFSGYSIWNFDAKNDKVVFSRSMLPEKQTIRYREISYIKVTRRHFATSTGTKWVETIHFILIDNSEISFYANLPIDYNKADYPMYMEVQFNSSKFMKLKKYIDNKINTDQGGKPNV